MTSTELPSSVLYTSKDFGPGTLSRANSGFRVQEARGLALKRQGTISERVLNLTKEGQPVSSILFRPSEAIDIIGIYPHSEKPRTYAARNGVYVELGVVGRFGDAFGRYELETGEMLFQEVNRASFPDAALPLTMATDDINFIVNLCSQLRNPRTPEPASIARINTLLTSNIRTGEFAQQQPLLLP